MTLAFSGIGELQDSNYELISIRLDNVLLADAHAAGGSLGCDCGPVVKTIHIPGPYLLLKNTSHEFLVNFTTNDPLYHVGCYYQINLTFTEV
jgi:hypothetical protein